MTLQECTGWFVVQGTALRTKENLLQHYLKKTQLEKIDFWEANFEQQFHKLQEELQAHPFVRREAITWSFQRINRRKKTTSWSQVISCDSKKKFQKSKFWSEQPKINCSSRTTRYRQEPNSAVERGDKMALERIFICTKRPSTSPVTSIRRKFFGEISKISESEIWPNFNWP